MSSPVSDKDKEAVDQLVCRLYRVAQEYFNKSFPLPAVSYRRSGRNAGTAFLQQNRINLHPILFVENRQGFFDDVIPHEISHLLTYQLFGRVKPHGREWQLIMQDVFHVPAKTTHSFDLTNVQTNTMMYQCECGDVPLTLRRHNKVLRGARYLCRRCNNTLVLKP
ncbi:SprT family zinc-dependent metalloprotease [Alteromonas sp. C1M14]|nr:SprT family zinc-dependent metalloprotease [Alteromonas sp. C1M14]MBU2977057.1 SprT family zinc-dependent metalloprotease [Alteromonas sp. C1M14]